MEDDDDEDATAGGDGAFVLCVVASDSLPRLDAISSLCVQMDFLLLGMVLLAVGGTCGGSDAAADEDALYLLL